MRHAMNHVLTVCWFENRVRGARETGKQLGDIFNGPNRLNVASLFFEMYSTVGGTDVKSNRNLALHVLSVRSNCTFPVG